MVQPEIWKNILKWFLIALVGSIVVGIVVGVLIVGSLPQIMESVSSLSGEESAQAFESTQIFKNFLPIITKSMGVGVVALALLYVVMLVSTIFFYKANKIIGEVLGVNSFILASRLILCGAILSIIVVGVVVALIGSIILTVAFFGSYKKK